MLPSPRHIRFITHWLMPLCLFLGACAAGLGVLYSLWLSPPDYQHGQWVRMMYLHVPAAWLSIAIYVFIGLLAILYLSGKNPTAFILSKAAAPIGLCFSILTLITGMLWGKAAWNAYWVWDARLTSMLLLAFLYVGYILLYRHYPKEKEAAFYSSILALVGLVNIPVIHFSVEHWNTLHQPSSILKSGGASIHSSMLTPLFLMFFAFLLLSLALGMWRYHHLIKQKQRFRALQQPSG